MTACGDTNDDEVGITTTLGFQCSSHASVSWRKPFPDMVGYRFNAAQYNMILHRALQ